MSVPTTWLAIYAAIVATLTLLLGYGRVWWIEHHPLKVYLTSGVLAIYRPLLDSRGKATARQSVTTGMVFLSCVNRSDISVRVIQAGFVPRRRISDRIRFKPPEYHVTLWPVEIGEVPADLLPRRRWETQYPWDTAPVDVTARIQAYCLLDDGRRCGSKRRRLGKPEINRAMPETVETPGVV
ncbi:MAG: hypothetical protein WAL84_05030 [Candidatus Dormiibacterota bacterium]